jgi:hypothetical protein
MMSSTAIFEQPIKSNDMNKNLFLILTLVLGQGVVHAQSDKYVKAMEARVPAVDTTESVEGWQQLANAFERIADVEKTQWLPYYYAAVSHIMQGYMLTTGKSGGFASLTDPLADKAEQMLNQAEALNKNSSEIWCVRKMIATLRLTADPMTRWQTYGQAAAEALAKAKQLDPENPRAYMLEGQDKYFTPEQFGGSKKEARALFETALKKFEAQKPKTSIDPQWGLRTARYFSGLASQ